MHIPGFLQKEISSSLALLVVFVLSTAVAIATMVMGARTLERSKASLETELNARNQILRDSLGERRAAQKGSLLPEGSLSD